MYSRLPSISGNACAPKPVWLEKCTNKNASGTKHASIIAPTTPIGMSCSVRGNKCKVPPWRARLAAIADANPDTTGLTSLPKVQIAATPIVPAPTKRTFVLHVAPAMSSKLPVRPCASAEKCGTPHTQPISAPNSIARPTHNPTR